MEVTALFAVSDKKPKRQAANTANIKDIAAEEAIASVVEEMELPADMTLQTKVESGRNKAVILKEARGYDLIVLGATEQKRLTAHSSIC